MNHFILAFSLVFVGVAGCTNSGRGERPGTGGTGGGGSDDGGTGGTGTDGGTPSGTYSDFPADPVLDPAGNAPADSPTLFGPADSGTAGNGPCLLDPEVGSLFPANWLPLRFHFTAPTSQNLFEIRLHADVEANDLVIYTTKTTYTVDKQLWNTFVQHVIDEPIKVSIRGGAYDGSKLVGGPVIGSVGTISLAPAAAAGVIAYWTSSNGTGVRGFKIGDTAVQDIVRPSQAGTACIGCHTSTPGGDFVAFSASNDANNGNPAQVSMRSADGKLTQPSFISTSAATLLARTGQEQPSFSKSHWTTGDRVALSMLYFGDTMPGKNYEIVWTDLEATSTDQGVGWGILSRGTGDPGDPVSEVFSHDGTQVAYVSGKTTTGGVTLNDGDLRVVPYNNRLGGDSTAVAGASDPFYNEYYPAFSPDDQWLAFNRVDTGQSSYNNKQSEVFLIPTTGGVPTRIAANDPPICAGRPSPGITNSWPKWSPDVATVGDRTFYWLTFSSTRLVDGVHQLYITPVVVEKGQVKTYPALYLYNQPASESNHTPAWDNFQIPIQ